jgi:hypothetical protein
MPAATQCPNGGRSVAPQADERMHSRLGKQSQRNGASVGNDFRIMTEYPGGWDLVDWTVLATNAAADRLLAVRWQDFILRLRLHARFCGGFLIWMNSWNADWAAPTSRSGMSTTSETS